MTTDLITMKRALLSVSDKGGLEALAAALVRHGVELVSTGGTAAALRAMGHQVMDVAELTGSPEMMDGRVKTLHPRVHGGLLALRDDAAHVAAMADNGIAAIEIAVINLYPFAATVARGAARDDIIENIDIGGPAMVRSSAKNHDFVTILTDPAQYAEVIAALDTNDGATDLALRRRLAAAAFAHTAAYDAAVASWFAFADQAEMFPPLLPLALTRAQTLRYGENPHQQAALYLPQTGATGVAAARQVQGKELSYNNLNDADGALELIAEFAGAGPACAIIKHANPCGVGTGATLADAYKAAFDCDPVSAFGGIIAVNQPLDGPTAQAIAAIFTEVVIAPDADADAIAVFAAKKNLRLLLANMPDPRRAGLALRQIGGGMLVQSRDNGAVSRADCKVVTQRAPTEQEWTDMLFAWTVARHVKSNAIVYAHGGATAGIGAGQMSRLDSTRIAAQKARDAAQTAGWPQVRTIGSAVASDAFFPFADGLIAAAEAGATAIIQPGGSIRDADVIAAADARGLAMVFTGMRHFKH
ncbi:bifunctional phosphoribosylaminoimidazolecarboxamide formyltransferase/IMP cyclohydrolase [Sandarakinorhabdus sp.]|uniref:bifunctional phosphoribosylaminoimidazolecarboxamide formyltransferase/IMP cyclohydrolase n=1 Tax=Sandarakinorhabdus sp. TaxID=1916663 RepID=UPI00286E701E|nr:bifunctional phosphoribosylaminoimidazolecarboxamide formyltransferase/IMP cyclohydrolase [Sandarakinorhabdus sp.]